MAVLFWLHIHWNIYVHASLFAIFHAWHSPNLPGADGPNPQLSSGAHKLETLKKGKFVDIFGTQSVNLEHGCWELIWRRNAKAGAFICAFDVPEEIKRNDAKIPKGRLYVTFPVWTEESLKDLKERKEKAEEVANEARQRLEDETRLMREEPNPIMKAMHFRAACKAHEDIDYSGYRSYNNMPLERDMINLDGLHICSLGTVWTKKDGFMGEHVLLGSASAMAFDPAELAPPEMKVFTRDLLKPTAYDGLRPWVSVSLTFQLFLILVWCIQVHSTSTPSTQARHQASHRVLTMFCHPVW